MGLALGAVAVAAPGSASLAVIGWTALGLAGLAAEQEGGRPGGRIAALGLALLAFPRLFGGALWARPSGAGAFSDPGGVGLFGLPPGPGPARGPRGGERSGP